MKRLFMGNKFYPSKQWIFLLFLISLIVSCSKSSHHEQKKGKENTVEKSTPGKPPSRFLDTVIVVYPTAVFYNPDSVQFKKIKAITEPMIFEGTMHDCFYQMRNSRMVLEKYYPKVAIEEVKNARYIHFKMINGSDEIVDLNSKNDPCGLLIFDGHKSPQLVDMTNVDTELGFYFSKN